MGQLSTSENATVSLAVWKVKTTSNRYEYMPFKEPKSHMCDFRYTYTLYSTILYLLKAINARQIWTLVENEWKLHFQLKKNYVFNIAPKVTNWLGYFYKTMLSNLSNRPGTTPMKLSSRRFKPHGYSQPRTSPIFVGLKSQNLQLKRFLSQLLTMNRSQSSSTAAVKRIKFSESLF